MTTVTPAAVERIRADVGQLLAEHTAGRPLKDFKKWADDPVGFDRNNGRDPVDYQEQIMRSVVENKYTVVPVCHASGKE